MCNLLEGSVAIVTGGTAGIGKAITTKFVENGAKVAIIGTNKDRGEAAVSEIKALFPEGQVIFYQADVGDGEAIEKSLKQIIDDCGKVDILVNNAGITRDGLLMSMKEEDFDSVINVNLKSVYFTCKTLIRSMIKARKGKVINVSSVVGLTGNAGQANYAASKSGMIGFTKSLAKEVATRGISVNCIAPGFVKTNMTDALSEKQVEEIMKVVPMKRMGEPEDIADAALFLASDMSNYMTGQVITVDGGMVM